MKTFEIKALGLEELSVSEFNNVTGGDIFTDWIFGKALDWIFTTSINSFKDGTQERWYNTMLNYNPYYCPLR